MSDIFKKNWLLAASEIIENYDRYIGAHAENIAKRYGQGSDFKYRLGWRRCHPLDPLRPLQPACGLPQAV